MENGKCLEDILDYEKCSINGDTDQHRRHHIPHRQLGPARGTAPPGPSCFAIAVRTNHSYCLVGETLLPLEGNLTLVHNGQ